MNDSALVKRSTEIVLAGEEPFDLAGWRVRPAALEIEHEGGTIALEPRVMQVLVALCRNDGEPLSRDALIDLCWGGRIVTEGALNRCVAQLRKALGANAGVRVETIPKVGYRLRMQPANGHAGNGHTNGATTAAEITAAPVTSSAEPDADAPERVTIGPRNWQVTAVGLLAVVVGVSLIWFFGTPRDVTWTATDYRPVTTEPGLETYPALSPTGVQIIYAGRPNPFAPSDLYLRNLERGPPIRLTSDAGDDYGAAWSPDGDQIAFARSVGRGHCSLHVVPIPRGPERLVTRCLAARETSPSWLNERTLVFADAPREGLVSRIRAVDVESGVVRDLTSPSSLTQGDTDPVVSPDGRYIAFRRTFVPGANDLFVLEAASGREQALTQDGWKASSYVWSNDSRHVFFSSNRGGEFGLWSVDLAIDGPPRQVSLGLGTLSFSRMSLDARNRLAMEIVRGPNTLARVSLDGVMEPVTQGTGSDKDAAAADDGTIAHISARSGSYQIWLARPGEEAARITSIRVSYVTTPVWSPDEKRIAFVAVSGHSAELYTVARDGSELRQVTRDGVEKRDPVYSPSGDRLFYVARTGEAWRLMEIGLADGSTPQAVRGGEGWQALRSDRMGHLYGQRGATILALDPDAPIVDIGLTDVDVWAAGPKGLYVRRGRTTELPSTIWFYPWKGPRQKLADIPLANSSIAVDANGAVIFSQSPDYQVDLGLVELHSDS
jgi:Tol biopolymer transport system component/DNA-binding winged helix-turn-helix (wHTH) protein